MANWITVFVEVPISTFNPVKVVNDLLREMIESNIVKYGDKFNKTLISDKP